MINNAVLRWALTGGLLLVTTACQHSNIPTANPLLEGWIAQASGSIAAAPAQYRLQVIYTAISRDAAGQIKLSTEPYRVDAEYLYPASTVKLAIAALALEYVAQLHHVGVDLDSVMQTEPLLPGDLRVEVDATATSGRPSVRHYVKKILLVSDNDAYNRLYELMGQQYIQQRLAELGFAGAEILHRLERPLSAADNRQTNAVTFYNQQGTLLYRQAARQAPALPARAHTPVGNDYLSDGMLQGKPLDFSQKNLWTLAQMHQMTQLIMLPDTIPTPQRLKLSPADLQFLQQQMALLPFQSTDPRYNTDEYWPTYVKFLIYGAAKDAEVDPTLHIYNKVGDAYGFLLDSAYVRDECSGAEFLLSAALYVNQDGVLNDDRYDYETVGLPFLQRLGSAALAHARSQASAQCAK